MAGPTLLIADPAEDVTFVRPSEALEVAPETLSLAFEAVDEAALAASEVVEACRTGAFRRTKRDCRSTARAAAADMLCVEAWVRRERYVNLSVAIC